MTNGTDTRAGAGGRVVCLQHAAFETPAGIGSWSESRGLDLSCVEVHKETPLPRLEGVRLLAVLGGPMSVNEEGTHPWLAAEKRYVADAIRAGLPVLGICLGAQMIASVLGARVYANREREIGWFPVARACGPDVCRAVAGLPAHVTAFHWHGETFDLPIGAVQVARSEACENQAFVWGNRVVGLQFHLEMARADVQRLVANCAGDLKPGRYVQSPGEMDTLENSAVTRAILFHMLDMLASVDGPEK